MVKVELKLSLINLRGKAGPKASFSRAPVGAAGEATQWSASIIGHTRAISGLLQIPPLPFDPPRASPQLQHGMSLADRYAVGIS